jgi:hypothetical protein
MSASAITGPSWTPWETKHAKGAALGEISLPEPTQKPEEAREAQEAILAPEVNQEERLEQINGKMSADLFAALLDQQNFAQTNPMGHEDSQSDIANGATSVNGGSGNLTETGGEAGSSPVSGANSEEAEDAQSRGDGKLQDAGSATVVGAQAQQGAQTPPLSQASADDAGLSPALLAQIEGARNPQAATERLARYEAYAAA